LPCDDRLMRLARLTARGVAAACGLPLDEAEDFRLVVDEVCATLFDACNAGPVHVGFRIDGGSLIVDGSRRWS
jgi:anti-sigma regulatory factor (Ser/Thr protein kinase)